MVHARRVAREEEARRNGGWAMHEEGTAAERISRKVYAVIESLVVNEGVRSLDVSNRGEEVGGPFLEKERKESGAVVLGWSDLRERELKLDLALDWRSVNSPPPHQRFRRSRERRRRSAR